MTESQLSEPGGVRRRTLLGAAGATVVAGAVAVPEAGAAEPGGPPLTADERAVVLQIARAGAVFPVAFPEFGEPGSAAGRAVPARLRTAEKSLEPERLAQVRAGARSLIADGLQGADLDTLLRGLGERAATADTAGRTALVTVTALALATISTHFAAGAGSTDRAADLWLDGLSRLRTSTEQGRRGRS